MAAPASAPTAQHWVLRLFFVSGLSGILFEVLWTRIFTYLLGGTTHSVTAVITAFMLGLGLGSYLFGRISDRQTQPLRLYGLLELGVAFSGLLAFYAFRHIESLYSALYAWAPQATIKWLVFFIAFVFVSLSATLIGGTLPVLARYVVDRDDGLKARLGQLYSINTLGAAAGAILMIGLVWVLGYEVGYHLALMLNAVTGLGALLLSRRHGPTPTTLTEASPAPAPSPEAGETLDGRILLPAFAVSGFCALAYEVIWFRLLDFLLLGRLTTFACVLSVYLLGISLGSLAFSRWSPAGLSDLKLFVAFETVLGFLGLLSLPLLSVISGAGHRSLSIAVGFLILFAMTLLLGGLFPLAGKLHAAPLRLLGRSVGSIYSANTAGSVLGSFLTGFVLFPAIGTSATLLLVAMLNLAVAVGVAGLAIRPMSAKWLGMGALLTAVGLAGWLGDDWLTRYYEHVSLRPDFHIIAERESSLQPVMVAENPQGERVLLGGPFQSGETVPARRQTQKLQAHLPMLVHSNPQRVLEIGYGVGELARTLLLYQPELLHLVELDENMVPMAEQYFGALNEHASTRPNVRVDVMDGRHFLKMSQEQYDVIMSDSMILASEGSLRLYTEEHFIEARKHLRPGGVALAWLPLNAGTTKAMVILKTFQKVFPQSLLWLPLGLNTQEAFIVGFRDEARIDLAAWQQKFDHVARADLGAFGWDSPGLFFASFRAGPERLKEIADRVPLLNRDMNPVLDFLPQETPAEIDAAVRQLIAAPPGSVFAHLQASASQSQELEALRDETRRVHEADQIFFQGVETLDRFGARPPEEVLANAEALTADFRKALEVYPRHHAAAVWMAQVLGLAAKVQPPLDPDRTRGLLEEASRYNPSDLAVAEALARLALERGDKDEAHKYIERVRTLAPYSRLAATEIP
ncbi:fused MFS/spermidine synthase [Hyalangium versicolor]|uniref:fused MFS/spermidine synthase n=1 Tax=Hyalangium versicolor TaxID=2861190 RepID=UPI001CCE0299|nr:fused MFS/spermidine synthase [Hyalangium versicolor]